MVAVNGSMIFLMERSARVVWRYSSEWESLMPSDARMCSNAAIRHGSLSERNSLMKERPAAYVRIISCKALVMVGAVLSSSTWVEMYPEASSTAMSTVRFPASMSDLM